MSMYPEMYWNVFDEMGYKYKQFLVFKAFKLQAYYSMKTVTRLK